MKNRILWAAISILMATALVLTSCGPAAEEEEEITVPAEEEVTVPAEEEEVAKEPQYGGTISIPVPGGAAPVSWDPAAATWTGEEWTGRH